MDRPIFVLGGQRSGTTLLRLVLDAHPDIAIGPESGFLRAVADTLTVRNWALGEGWFERFDVDRAAMVSRLATFYDEFFSDHARAQGASRWGEKTPMSLAYAGLAAELFPDARFVGIVRHPGAVCASLHAWDYPWEAGARMVADVTRSLLVERDRVAREAPDARFGLWRYEDLLRDPEGILREVLDLVEVPWSDDVLRHHEVHAERGAPEQTDGGTRPADPFDTARIDAWRRKVDDEALATIWETVGPFAELLGYTPEGSLPRADAPALQHTRLGDRGTLPELPELAEPPEQQRLAHLRRRLREAQLATEKADARAEAAAQDAAAWRDRYERLNSRRFVQLGRKLLDRKTAP